MRDDHRDRPSLLLASHEHGHQHKRFHKRGTGGESTTTAPASVLTEVSVTVSVVQQVDVDSNGNTISILRLLETTPTASQVVLTDISPASSTAAAVPPLYSVSGASSTASSSSEIHSPFPLSQSSFLSQTLTSNHSISASFASLLASSNSTTTLISSSSSLSHAFANSSSLSSPRSSLTYLLTSSSSSSTSSDESSTSSKSSSSAFSSTSTSYQPKSTVSVGILGGGTAIAPGTATSTAASSGNAANSSSGSPVSTSAVVGGVVGSVAGVAVIALLLLFIVKWRRSRNGTLLSLGSGRDGAGDTPDTATGGQPSQPSGSMTERRSVAYVVPAALANLMGYDRSSRQTDRTISSTAGSERGFYKVSGRKLPSVLQTGGDGYGRDVPDDHTLDGSSFYRDSHGFYGGQGSPTFPPLETHRESAQIGTPIMRPSPARMPVTEQSPFSDIHQALDPLPPRRPDVLGRSHPSRDGSHASKFTEEV